MYDVLVAWETIEDDDPVIRDFAQLWRAADKVVYSRTLEAPSSARTRIEREFDPEAVRAMKAELDMVIGGPELAGQALRAGLVDELHLFLSPVVVGGGNPALPDGVRVTLELTAERRFGNGVVQLSYRATS
jgi:dihydrofolate reductase